MGHRRGKTQEHSSPRKNPREFFTSERTFDERVVPKKLTIDESMNSKVLYNLDGILA